MDKKILHLDMDGVLADFDKAIHELCPELQTDDQYADHARRMSKVYSVCEDNPDIFHDLAPIEGAIEAVHRLFEIYDVFFLSTGMWRLPNSFAGKRVWLETHFGELALKRLILTHRKDLVMGDILVDDRLVNGAREFKGLHIHFGTPEFPNWKVVLPYLEKVAQEVHE